MTLCDQIIHEIDECLAEINKPALLGRAQDAFATVTEVAWDQTPILPNDSTLDVCENTL